MNGGELQSHFGLASDFLYNLWCKICISRKVCIEIIIDKYFNFFHFKKMYFYISNDWMKINFLKLKLAWIIFQILCSTFRYKKINRHTMQSAKLLRCWSTVKRTPLKLPRSTSIQQRRLVNLFKFHWLVHRACDKKCDRGLC